MANAIQLHAVAEKDRPLIDHRILTEPNRILSIFKDQAQWDMFHAFLFTNHQTGTLPINALSAMTPMIAQQEVAVREICCAVGAAGAAFTNPNSDPVADQKQYQLSLVYYNRAVQAIRGAEITTHTLLTVALVSILFITYDMIRGDMQTAYVHFDYCDQIIKSYFEKRCEEAGVPLAQIQLSTFESAVFEMFQRLTTYPWVLELGLDGSKVEVEHRIRKKCEGDLHRHRLREMPQFFVDLPQALMWWDVTQHHLFHHHDFMDSSEENGPEGISSTDTAWKESLAILQQWHNGFLPLLQTARQKQYDDPRPYLSACVLEALYVETLAGLHLRHHPDTNVLPNARSIYFDMIKTARTMQQQWNPANGFLSLDNTIVRPLIFVLLKCRDADVRQAVEELVLEIDQGSQLARPLLVMMGMDGNSKLPQKLRNVERALGWYLTSCGCNSGLSSAP
ncbi:hypothetical protein FDECE_12603 [Fusarium decemcellulare]|nr:hypothetical protein FDECE_12603 [Fusarium decemcellulare]